ncbi:GDSL-type esterase/lipase family protein [Gracilibacillus xinjiangensis]|uniref:GDSL-type esterase/lipase family protein n=1 Tax=Gracilibacillus xinjiangensis TaxID=1193282 RepID=A0ABV8WSL1_9BACI
MKKILISLLVLLIIGSTASALIIIDFGTNNQDNISTSSPDTNQTETNELNIDDHDQESDNENLSQELEEEIEEETENFGDAMKDVFIDALTFFKKDTHIVAIGDSLTQGVGDETDNGGYVGVLEEHFDNEEAKVTIDNFGKRGNRTDQLLKRLENEEIVTSIEDADIVLITIGANDIMKVLKDNFIDLTEEPFIEERGPYKDRLGQIINRVFEIQPDTEIYLLGFFNPFEQYFSEIEELEVILTRWNNESRMIANNYDKVTFIPMQDIFQNRSENMFAEDNFHPNRKGYELMAKRVWTYLQNNENLTTN